MKRLILLMLPLVVSCKILPDNLQPGGKDKEVLISQFERASYSDLLIAKDGTLHAVFLESAAIGKPEFVYYSFSSNGGKSWSKPVEISNDGTGNASGYARIIQDGRGTIYAIWKRFGNSEGQYPVKDVTLEGTGGYGAGTIFYSVLQGGVSGNPVMLAEEEETQFSWFPCVDGTGKLHVMWSQISSESRKSNWDSWYFADYLRIASISGGSVEGIADLTKPSPPENPNGGAPLKNGWINLRGHFDRSGKLHFTGEVEIDGVRTLAYYDGFTSSIVYQFPLYSQGNTQLNPPVLLTDENGDDHLIMRPPASTKDFEEIWDINLTKRTNASLVTIAKVGMKIEGFQAFQGPDGQMAVTIQAGELVSSNETYGLFYRNGVWQMSALTENASKETFNYGRWMSVNILPTSTNVDTDFVSMAWGVDGSRSMLMTVSKGIIGDLYSVSKPSLYAVALDQ